jgi:hypothetical protein
MFLQSDLWWEKLIATLEKIVWENRVEYTALFVNKDYYFPIVK